MLLGQGLIDKEGKRHAMAGLLPHSTRFDAPKLTLGYRLLTPIGAMPYDGKHRYFSHEFHYSSQDDGDRPNQLPPALFKVQSPKGQDLGDQGITIQKISGSYQHIIAINA